MENLRTAASEKKPKKQQMNDRFNIKNGVTENLSNYLPEKCNKKTILAKVWNRSTQ